MNVLLIGAGGREHAFATKLVQSEKLGRLFIAPGNAGTAMLGENIPIQETEFEKIKEAVLAHQIEMVVVGPEVPLVNGIVDFFAADELLKAVPVIGPNAEAAQLEGSKDFSKKFMLRHNIPTAAYQTFISQTISDGYEFLETLNPPFVLKADGLAAGKGVLILNDVHEAKRELNEMLHSNKFGQAGARVVIEEFLQGIELSVFVLTDGISYKLLPNAKDYKRIGEGDTGPNTGGMGAISPVPFADEAFMKKVEERIIVPTIKGLKKEKIHYQGFLFIGLMNVGGDPFVIEYNCRLGDPETEAILSRIDSDLLALFEGVAKRKLKSKPLVIADKCAATIVLASGGYPGKYDVNKVISGLDKVANCQVFHAGTKLENGKVLTSGGRVIAITAVADTIQSALELANVGAAQIEFEGKVFRKDIGMDLLR